MHCDNDAALLVWNWKQSRLSLCPPFSFHQWDIRLTHLHSWTLNTAEYFKTFTIVTQCLKDFKPSQHNTALSTTPNKNFCCWCSIMATVLCRHQYSVWNFSILVAKWTDQAATPAPQAAAMEPSTQSTAGPQIFQSRSTFSTYPNFSQIENQSPRQRRS